jgi:5-methyltetrahydropteroyltriglutamate--homocysteine methyltransferase
MAIATNLGFPRVGSRRELKRAIEAYWEGTLGREELEATARGLRLRHWELQRDLGIRHIPSGDFSLYDHVLDTAVMVGAIPERFHANGHVDLDAYFAMARGTRHAAPLDMTKWFDTNYHYLVPEFEPGQTFHLGSTVAIDAFREAQAAGIHTRPVLLGPVSFLLLGKSRSPGAAPLALADRLVGVYEEVLAGLAAAGADWVQIDEPVLALDLPPAAIAAMESAYARLAAVSENLRLCLTTYFGDLRDNLALAIRLPVAAVHLDLVRGPEQLNRVLEILPAGRMLSLGVIDGRNIWRADLQRAADQLCAAADRIGPGRILVGPSCSLLHCPIDLDLEADLDPELKGWLAFARQKLEEIALLTRAVNEGPGAVA